MNRTKRARIYIIIAITIFLINLFNVDFDNLKWAVNKTHYVNMIVAVLVCTAIFILSKRNNK